MNLSSSNLKVVDEQLMNIITTYIFDTLDLELTYLNFEVSLGDPRQRKIM